MCIGRMIAPKILKIIGLRKGIIMGIFSYSFFSFIFFITEKYPAFLLASFLWGIGAAIFWTSSLTFLLNIIPKERYGVENGILRVFLQVGLIAGFLIYGQILIFSGYKEIFLIATIIAFVAFLISFFLKEEKREFHLPDFSKFIFSPALLKFSFGLLIGALGYGMVLNFINHFIVEKFGKEFLNRIIVFFFLSAGILSYIGGKLIDKFGEFRISSLFFFISGITLIIFARFPTLLFSVISLLILGGLYQIIPVSSTVRIGKLIREEYRSSAIAGVFLWRDFGIGASILLLGYLKDKMSYGTGFMIIGIVFSLMGLIFIDSGLTENKGRM